MHTNESENSIPEEKVSTPEVASFEYSASTSPRRLRSWKVPKASPSSPALVGGYLPWVLVLVLSLGIIATSNAPSIVALRQKIDAHTALTTSSNGTVAVQQPLIVQESSAVITAAKKVSPAVVAITASQQVTSYFGQSSNQEVSSGSGFIISADGLILTNKHVVSTDGATYKVILDDGRVFDATVQSVDPLNDLAVVKIAATGLPVVNFGSSDDLQVGQSVLAIGNALGEFQNSVTTGIVSGKARSISPQSDSGTGETENLTDLIQTDAAINPGNSGGPLVNLDGQVVGINTAIASTTGASVGIGFAIPVDDFIAVITSVEKTGKISVPYLGVRYQQIDTTIKQLDNLSVDYGALIYSDISQGLPAVVPGSPADKAGIQAQDVILSLNGAKIDSNNTLQRALQKHLPGDQITLTILRAGKQIQVKVTLGSQG